MKNNPEDRADKVAKSLVASLHADREKLERRVRELEVSLSSQTKLQKHSYLFEQPPHSIRDPIYGSIPLSERASRTLNKGPFQRLKYLCQTGPCLHAYPGLHHTRFGHSVGVYHLMRLALQHFALLPEVDFEPEQGNLCLCVALIHDIGHFPHSHVLEEIRLDNRELSHQMLSAYLIQNDSELSSTLQAEWGVSPDEASAVLLGQNHQLPTFLYKLLDSTVDLDKMDYLCRDAYHAGVPYGLVDVKWLISSFLVDPRDQDLLISDAGIGAVEEMIFAKYLMYRNVYWHHTTREATAMLKRAAVDFFLEHGLDSLDLLADSRLRELCLATDSSFIAKMKRIGKAEVPVSSFDLLERLRLRRLYKRVHVFYASEPEGSRREADYGDAKRRREKERDICTAIRSLPQWQSAHLNDWDILIDVAKPVNFPIDIKGVFFDDPPPSYAKQAEHVVSWNEQRYVSYFSTTLLKDMEEGIRKVRYFYNPENPKGEELRNILRAHVELY